MSSDGAKKDIQRLVGVIKRHGYSTRPGRGGYLFVFDRNGNKVVDENGPVKFSGTPSDFRARDLAAARLVRANIISDRDLWWKPELPKSERGAGGLMLANDEAAVVGQKEKDKFKAQDRRAEENRNRHERTQLLRARLEPLLAALGGWGKRGMQAEIAAVLYDYAKDTPYAFASKQSAVANVGSFRKGGTLSENAATVWESLLNDLEMAPNLTERWFDLVRQVRGLPPRSVPVVAQTSSMEPEEKRLVLAPAVGGLARGMEERDKRRWQGDRYTDDEHPVLEFHRNGGLRWYVDITIDDLNELNRVAGVLEGLALQLSLFEGGEIIAAAQERLDKLIVKIGEARHRELVHQAKEA